MASLNMHGPYNLTNEEIDKHVTETSPGNYALGYSKDGVDGPFFVNYVGRSDLDVNDRLKDWVGEYKQFKYSYATSPKVAFEKGCHNYHEFGESKNLITRFIHRDPLRQIGNALCVIFLTRKHHIRNFLRKQSLHQAETEVLV